MEFLLLGALALILGATFINGGDDDAAPATDTSDEGVGGEESGGGGGDPDPEGGGDLMTEIFGTDGNDTPSGETDQIVRGGAGDDCITTADDAQGFGEAGNDYMNVHDRSIGAGGDGDDTLTDSTGAHLFGGRGDDVLIGDGSDELTGGAGADTFTLELYREDLDKPGNAPLPVTITDFNINEDMMVMESPPVTGTTITTNEDTSETELRLSFAMQRDIIVTLQNTPGLTLDHIEFRPLPDQVV